MCIEVFIFKRIFVLFVLVQKITDILVWVNGVAETRTAQLLRTETNIHRIHNIFNSQHILHSFHYALVFAKTNKLFDYLVWKRIFNWVYIE